MPSPKKSNEITSPNFYKKHWLIILFLLFYSLFFTHKLVTHVRPFYDWDEAIYAQVGKEMIAKQSLVPLWQGQAWLDKPPLVPLLYGVVETITPAPPEVSTRVFTLFITVMVLSFIYALYYRISKNALIAVLTVVITASMPIFLQRAQVVNIDVFMLLGWLGYALFFENYWLSLLFLGIGVLSKSLLGFYPPVIFLLFYSYKVVIKQITFSEYKKKLIFIMSQVMFFGLWYVVMYLFYGNAFIQAHIIESHFKRVTASIESHFGKRTFYVDLLLQEFSFFILFSITGLVYISKKYRNKFGEKAFLYSIFLLPWFLFLNLTKTKIAWYYHPVIPQFAYLAASAPMLFKNISTKTYMAVTGVIIILLLTKNTGLNSVNSYYSNFEPHYYMALYAKENCRGTLHVVIDKDTRQAHDTLSQLNLLISTSTWWGNHASVVYYYGGKVDFIYDVNRIAKTKSVMINGECIVINEDDEITELSKSPNIVQIKKIKPYLVYRRVSR